MVKPPLHAIARACALLISAVALLGSAPAASAHGGAHFGISHRDQLPPALAHGAGKARAASAPGAGLPAAWCGSRTTRDQDINSPSPEAAAIKFVYAYPADRPDRSGQIARMLQGSAREIGLYIAAESGGRKSVRFDLGTRCGPRYLDIATVPLSGPRSSYLAGSRVGAYQIRDEVARSVGRADAPRNYLVYVDNLLPSASYGEAEGIFEGGDEPGADNPHNAGGLYGFVWSEDGASLDLPDTTHLVLHELSHTLGAVQESAAAQHGARPLPRRHRRDVLRGWRHSWGCIHRVRTARGNDRRAFRLQQRRLLRSDSGPGFVRGEALERLRLRVPGRLSRVGDRVCLARAARQEVQEARRPASLGDDGERPRRYAVGHLVELAR